MAKGIGDIGNYQGYIYAVNSSLEIVAVVKNDPIGIRSMRGPANISSPLAGPRSAFGTLTIVSVDSAGNITNVDVGGVNQLSGAIALAGTETPAEVCELIADNINNYTPVGYNFSATAIDAVVYIFAPPSAGGLVNGNAITVSATGSPAVTYTSEALKNGTSFTGIADPLFGFKFYLDANYGPNGISGEVQADPNSLGNGVEITKYLVGRGLQTGIFTKDAIVVDYEISNLDRSGAITQINLEPNAGLTDTLVKIAADDFVEGDILFLRGATSAIAITVESAPTITVGGGVTGNIYLTDDIPWVGNRYTVLMLQYRNDQLIGPIFSEISRSFAAPSNFSIPVNNTVFVMKNGDDTSGIRESFIRPFLTITAATAAAQSGDTIVVYPGNYADGNLQKDGVSYYLHEGVTVTVPQFSNLLNITTENVVVEGHGDIVTDTGNLLTMQTGATGSAVVRVKSVSCTLGGCQLNGGTTVIEIETDYTSNYRHVYFAFAGNHFLKAKRMIQTFSAGSYSPFGTFHIRCGTGPFLGKAHVVCEDMIIDTDNGAGGQGLMYIEAVASPGSLRVDAKRMFNRFTGFLTNSIYIANSVSNVEINGNLYCDGTGSLANGIHMEQPGGIAAPQYVKFNGNIITDEGYAAYMGACPNLEINGDIQKNAEGTPVSPFVTDAAIYFKADAPIAVAGIANFRHRGNIYINATGCNAINKEIQATTNPTYNPRTELDMICDIRDNYVYVADPAQFVCEGPLATEALIDNSIVVTGAVSNLATPTSAGIVEVAGTIAVDSRVGKDTPLVTNPYPFINY